MGSRRIAGIGLVLLWSSLLTACGSGSTDVSPLAPTGGRCGVTVGVSRSSVEAVGGTVTLKINTARECQWSVSTAGTGLSFQSATEGQGPAEVAVAVDPNRSTQPRRL